MLQRAKELTLVLHIGLHKTATTYVQGLLSAHRAALLREGVLYPRTGTVAQERLRTRDGAQSGHALFTRRRGRPRALKAELLAEVPDSVNTVLLSSEEFARPIPDPTPDRILRRFADFGRIQVVLVLRRQDDWIESFYKQVVDQFANYETRSMAEYVRDEGPTLLDYHSRFSPWRALVGPENFHVLSYDDLGSGAAISRRVLEIAGVGDAVLDDVAVSTAPRYESVRAVDTLGLRILNGYRLGDRDVRTEVARSIYELAPSGEVELLTPRMRDELQETYAPVNERVEAEWCGEPVPGLRFGSPRPASGREPPSGPEVVDYVGRVIALCEEARGLLQERVSVGRQGSGAAQDRGTE